MLLRRNSSYQSIQPNRNIDPSGNKQRKSLRFFLLGLIVLIVGTVGWITVSGIIAFKNISAKNADDRSSFFRHNGEISPDQLLGEGDSRINILSLGIDAAAGLTDSIEIVSIDPINKKMALLSVPRDLYVYNSAENRKTKINEVYNSGVSACSKKEKTCDPKVDAGGALMKKTISDNLGIQVSYFARVDFSGVKKIVDTLGGIQIYVDKAIYDPKYPNSTNTGFDPFSIKAGLQNLSGETALKYSRSRQTTSDFDRTRRQQQVISAIRQKAFQLNFLANPKKITDLISTIGRNFKTDLQSGEIVTLSKMIAEIDSADTTTAILDNGPNAPLVSTTNNLGQYVLIPKISESDWSEIQEFTMTALPEPYLVKEAARVKIIDSSGKIDLADKLKKKLNSLGYTISRVDTTSTTQKNSTITYSTDKPYTLALLKRRFGLKPQELKTSSVGSEDIIFTIGSTFSSK
ncbi:MAG: Cell envelope-related transcriptional attenuator [Berkelbacteria bacterium GW2011_GWA2_46_7]|uniref:Cell envelope-related transcriptional attenuator n=1 Tax=Berkelbacteria bacterium GW2011_GWA2_46_7 TaxID=1618335 RepID=A0A0G1QG35_9BACT|nr:MAG: Cell envelope-related transcriptional attenuator [Berkelbacteria bacterium GW2011_GWA2_46_7]